MITAAELKFEVRRGDTWEGETFRVLAPTGNGGAWWASTTVKSQIRHVPDGRLVKEFSLTPVVTTESGTGVLTFSIALTDAESKLLAVGDYVGDIQITCPQFGVLTFVHFTLEVFPDVTR